MDKDKIEDRFEALWKNKVPPRSQDCKETSWKEFQEQAFPPKKRSTKIWHYAAAILILFLSGTTIFLFQDAFNAISYESKNVVENPTSDWKTVILPDSSIVELQSHSKLIYATDFNENRNITLIGEGYFKVQKDRNHPFRVLCNQTTITVLGTSFTVKNITEGVSVALYEGSVQMNIKDSTQNWILSPGEKFTYDKNTVVVESFERFKDFDNDKLKTAISYIENNYGYQIFIPEDILNKHITLRINKKEELSTIIELISELYNLNYQIDEELKQVHFH